MAYKLKHDRPGVQGARPHLGRLVHDLTSLCTSHLIRSPGILTAAAVGAMAATAAQFIDNWVADRATGPAVGLDLLLLGGLLVVLLEVASVRHSLSLHASGVREGIEYLPAATPRQVEQLYARAAKVVREAPAGARIYAVNSLDEVYASPDRSARAAHACRGYLRAFESRFGDVSYRRLVQVDSTRPEGSDGWLRDRVDVSYLRHYKSIVTYEARNDQIVQLTEVEQAIPISFVVIEAAEGGRVILQLHRSRPQPGLPHAVEMLGILIIDDPDGRLIPTFMSWFSAIDSGSRRDLTLDDLAAPQTPTRPWRRLFSSP